MNYWFTADLHLFHEIIIYLQPRPFRSLQEMHEVLVEKWNEHIKPGDIVWVLGDFAQGPSSIEPDLINIFKRLNGEKFLIRGNHDMRNDVVKRLPWRWQGGLRSIKINNQYIFLSHYAMRVWNKQGHSSWNLYGHSHGNLIDDPNLLAIDVGVDAHDYAPISFEDISKIMSQKTWVPPQDHHGILEEPLLSNQDLFNEWKTLLQTFRTKGFFSEHERYRYAGFSSALRKRGILKLDQIKEYLEENE